MRIARESSQLIMNKTQLLCRFKKSDFDRLMKALQIPVKYQCVQKTLSTGSEALLIMLRRLAYPSRWSDLEPTFGRSVSEMSLIFQTVRNHAPCLIIMYYVGIQIIDDVYERFHHLLEDLDLVWLDAPAFAEAIKDAGSQLDNCWGFIDGTTRPIARPVRNQSVVYSGHKRYHCLKFQVNLCYFLCVCIDFFYFRLPQHQMGSLLICTVLFPGDAMMHICLVLAAYKVS